MSEPIPIFVAEAYAILYNKFGKQPFSPGYLKWFLSEPMAKKIVYVLEKKGWISRIGRGRYVCRKPEEVIREMVRFRVPELLDSAEKKYCYTGMSATEVWTDFTYMQRSWEHSPYYIKILDKDLPYWKAHFRSHGIPAFEGKAQAAIGEFVVLIPKKRFACTIFDEKPVDPIDEVVEFCRQNIDMFEYPLAYLIRKFHLHVKADIDPRIVEEARRVI